MSAALLGVLLLALALGNLAHAHWAAMSHLGPTWLWLAAPLFLIASTLWQDGAWRRVAPVAGIGFLFALNSHRLSLGALPDLAAVACGVYLAVLGMHDKALRHDRRILWALLGAVIGVTVTFVGLMVWAKVVWHAR